MLHERDGVTAGVTADRTSPVCNAFLPLESERSISAGTAASPGVFNHNVVLVDSRWASGKEHERGAIG